MTHDELRDKILKAMGGPPPFAARSSWAKFIYERRGSIWLNYDWIKDNRFYQWCEDHPDVEIGGGSTGVEVEIVNFLKVNN